MSSKPKETDLGVYLPPPTETLYQRYPAAYVPLPIGEQIDRIAKCFGLNPAPARQYASRLPPLPAGAEAWFAVPSLKVLTQRLVPKGEPADRYAQVVKFAFEKNRAQREIIVTDRNFTAPCLMLDNRAKRVHKRLEQQQRGSIHIIAAQLGLRYAGIPANRIARKLLPHEFGLTSLMAISIVLTHPERIASWDELSMLCLGDRMRDPNDVLPSESFLYVPSLGLYKSYLMFAPYWRDICAVRFGAATGFLF